MNDKESILNKLTSEETLNLIKKYNVSSLILFGSLNGGDFNEESDIDLAIIGNDKIELDNILEMELYFENLCKREIDLIDLKSDSLDMFVKINILNKGRVLYSYDNNLNFKSFKNLVDMAYKENNDFIYFRRRDILSMNESRLIKVIEDFEECLSDIDECIQILEDDKNSNLTIKLAKSSLRQLFVSFHTILEDFCSIMLREIKKYKIGISLHDALLVLNENKIIDDDLLKVLDKSRLIRNRISHRYKEPGFEELYKHVKLYRDDLRAVADISKKYLNI